MISADVTGRGQRLAGGTRVDVLLLVKREVGSAECAVVPCALVPAWDWSSSQLLSLCRDTIVSERESDSFAVTANSAGSGSNSRWRPSGRMATDLTCLLLTALLDNPIYCDSAIKAARAIESR